MFRSDSNSHLITRWAKGAPSPSAALLAFSLCLTLSAVSFTAANGEGKAAGAARAGKVSEPSAEAEENGAAISTNRQKPRDPFVVPSRVKREPKVAVKKEPRPVPVPDIESRLTNYRTLVRAAANGGVQTVPDKTSPYLVEELTVTGIFRDAQGYGAFIAAEPTKLTFFARPGMRTHDGIIKEVLPTGVKFIRTIRFDDGTVRQSEEFRALRSLKAGK